MFWSRGEDAPAGTFCLHEMIEARVREQPDAIAVVYEESSLTYGELNGKANQLARHLRTLGVGPDVLVGLAAERSLEMVVGLLAILKAGGAYVPLDPAYPKERLTFMIEDAGLSLVLTQAHLLGDLCSLSQGHDADRQSILASASRASLPTGEGLDARSNPAAASGPMLFCLDRDWPDAAAHPDMDLAKPRRPGKTLPIASIPPDLQADQRERA